MVWSKAELRKGALQRREAVPAAVREGFAERLARIGLGLVRDFAPPNPGLIVSVFSPIGSEPDVLPLVQALAAADVITALPMTASHGGPLVFRRWAPGDPLSPGAMKILEPMPDAPEVEPDVLFVPLAVFDRRGHRIGYGAGHYDRTLAELRARKRLRAIGVAFSVQEELFVPNDEHDQPMDLVVTERDVLLCAA